MQSHLRYILPLTFLFLLMESQNIEIAKAQEEVENEANEDAESSEEEPPSNEDTADTAKVETTDDAGEGSQAEESKEEKPAPDPKQSSDDSGKDDSKEDEEIYLLAPENQHQVIKIALKTTQSRNPHPRMGTQKLHSSGPCKSLTLLWTSHASEALPTISMKKSSKRSLTTMCIAS